MFSNKVSALKVISHPKGEKISNINQKIPHAVAVFHSQVFKLALLCECL